MQQMIPVKAAMLLLTLGLAASPALAKNDKHDGKGHGKGHGVVQQTAHVGHCPPGLAKKNPPCVPPGQAKKGYAGGHDGDYRYRVGDELVRDYHLISDPYLYGLAPLSAGQRYVIVDNRILQVDSGTLEVLALLNVVEAVLD